MKIEPNAEVLGATITGVDLHKPLSDADFAEILLALGRHCVLRFPGQLLSAEELRDFSGRFGALQTGLANSEPGVPEVSILSNVKQEGKYIGLPDAGQDWHTDMSYNRVPGYVNVLVAYQVPVRDGVVRGNTEFCDTAAAYEALPEAMRQRLADAIATHDLNKYWEHMRREKGSTRAPLTPEQRKLRPPVQHPVFLTHPVSGRKVIYVNPGFTDFIHGMDRAESDRILAELFAHIMKPEFRYVHRWQQGDLLIWDHLNSWHCAMPDYRPDESRLMKRCQVMADRILDPAFVQRSLAARAAA
jgi:taurine dioxygenase